MAWAWVTCIYAYAHLCAPSEGGGTFDTSLLAIDGGVFEVRPIVSSE